MFVAKNIGKAMILGLTVGIFFVGIIAFAQWTSPTALPPGDNIFPPLNAGNLGQTKQGGLVLNTGGATIGLIVATGTVGIGTSDPKVKLDVNGEIKVGNSGVACSATVEGAIRYNAGSLELCDGTGWGALGGAGDGFLGIGDILTLTSPVLFNAHTYTVKSGYKVNVASASTLHLNQVTKYTAADVSTSVEIYDSGCTLMGSASFSGVTATVTGISLLSGEDYYIVTVGNGIRDHPHSGVLPSNVQLTATDFVAGSTCPFPAVVVTDMYSLSSITTEN